MKLIQKGNRLSVVGELDRFSLSNAQQFIFPQVSEQIVFVELQKIKNVDTAGLAWLLKLVSYYQKKNKEISISHAPKQLIALAELSNVLALLPIIKST